MFPFKVCCIQSTDEADRAINAGALAIGLVGEMPNGPGVIDDERIAAIASHTREQYGYVWSTLLTSRTEKSAIVEHIAKTGVNSVQIVDWPEDGAWDHVRQELPRIRIIQVVHVEGADAAEQVRQAQNKVDAILLDSGKPSSPGRTLGGTGETHDWSISKEIVATSRTPVFLAGGLNPANARKAIKTVKPFGVDICSGLRNREGDYSLEDDKLKAFTKALRSIRL